VSCCTKAIQQDEDDPNSPNTKGVPLPPQIRTQVPGLGDDPGQDAGILRVYRHAVCADDNCDPSVALEYYSRPTPEQLWHPQYGIIAIVPLPNILPSPH
jgi:hypothetical protein